MRLSRIFMARTLMVFTACQQSDEALDADAITNSVGNDPASIESNPGNSDDGGDASSQTSDCTLSGIQQQLLDAHNNARAQSRNCGNTAYPATTPLAWDCTLAQIAQEHNTDMGTVNFFSHTGSDGLSVSDRASNAGYSWSTIGENIAAGYQDVDQVMQGWLDSSGHCANLMNPQYQELGADVYEASGSDYSSYWTANFGTER